MMQQSSKSVLFVGGPRNGQVHTVAFGFDGALPAVYRVDECNWSFMVAKRGGYEAMDPAFSVHAYELESICVGDDILHFYRSITLTTLESFHSLLGSDFSQRRQELPGRDDKGRSVSAKQGAAISARVIHV